tara:strand:+ start:149 stop:361 length:213 start_codon:yes stop_codon:yes gene_type:complete
MNRYLDNLHPSIEMLLAIALSFLVVIGIFLTLYVVFVILVVRAVGSVVITTLKANKHLFLAERETEVTPS